MGAAAAPLMLIGTMVSAAATVKAGVDQNRIAQYNAEVREVAAQDERARGAAEGALRLADTRRFMATQIAQINAMGGQLGGATELEIAESTARRAEMDFLNTMAGSEMAALGLEAEGAGMRAEGRAARSNAILGGLGRVVQGGGQFAMAMGES